MAVKIRLLRMGRKKKPFYRIVAIDTKSRRDGRYLDKIGYYDPLTKPATVNIDKEKILGWLEKGATPSETVFNLLQKEGIALEWHLVRNKISDQAKNVEIQKWELSRKKSTGVDEVAEKPKTIKAKKAEPETAPVIEPVETVEPIASDEPAESSETIAAETPETAEDKAEVSGEAPAEEKPEA